LRSSRCTTSPIASQGSWARRSATPVRGWLLQVLYFGGVFKLGASGPPLFVLFVIVPWIGVMMAGYAFGRAMEMEASARRAVCLRLGISLCVLFVCLRIVGVYGDPRSWAEAAACIVSLAREGRVDPWLLGSRQFRARPHSSRRAIRGKIISADSRGFRCEVTDESLDGREVLLNVKLLRVDHGLNSATLDEAHGNRCESLCTHVREPVRLGLQDFHGD
jgi:hypothetical protein